MKNFNFFFSRKQPRSKPFFFFCLGLAFILTRVIFSYGVEEPLNCELINVIFRVYFPGSGVFERRESKRSCRSLKSVGAVVCSKLYGQLYLLIGCYLLLTKYMARDVITEVQYNFSCASGNARAFIITVQVL